MDDILGLQLPHQHAIQLQSVRLFLRVSVLSEITDHTGLRLLPAAIRVSSTEYNQNNPKTPWYGMGQGAGDACNRWVIGADSMSNAYTESPHGWTVTSPISSQPMTQTIKAFVDDVNLFIGKPHNSTETEFLHKAQHDINHWHGIL